MYLQEKINSGEIKSSLKSGYNEATREELFLDFPFICDSILLFDLYGGEIAIFKKTGNEKFYFIYLFTEKHSYLISMSENYIGCVLSNRYYEPLEDWTRGRDLPDGKCEMRTWNRILHAILASEMVKIIK